MRGYSTLWTVIVDCIVLHYMHIWHLRIQASSLQFQASKINMALARMDKLVKKLMSNPAIRNMNCLWWPCLLTDQNGMSNSHRGLSIDASYQVSIYLAKLCQSRRFFRNWPIRNKKRLWWPCLLMDRDGMSNIYRGPSIDASY
jgi:hypothetical protein